MQLEHVGFYKKLLKQKQSPVVTNQITTFVLKAEISLVAMGKSDIFSCNFYAFLPKYVVCEMFCGKDKVQDACL